MGQQLNDIFQPGETSLDGVPIPYAGWVYQMTGCPPTVAQALLQYPQYCGAIAGIDENAGNSTYHSFQLKAEKRYAHGIWLLGSYTLSKELTSSDNPQQGRPMGSFPTGQFRLTSEREIRAWRIPTCRNCFRSPGFINCQLARDRSG